MKEFAASITRSGPFYRCASIGVAASLVAMAGCGSPDAASTNARWEGDQFAPAVVLSGAAADAAVSGMRAPSAGYQARPLVPAADGVRWSDVKMAILNVAERSFLGVPSIKVTDALVTAVIVSADGQRGSVRVTKGAAGEIVAEVQLGTFADPKADGAFAQEFDREMRRLGAIARPQA